MYIYNNKNYIININVCCKCIKDGLGNQLFHIACSYGYSRKYNKNCIIHLNSIEKTIFTHTDKSYINTIFSKYPKINISNYIINYNESYYNACNYIELPNFNNNNELILLRGNFQNEKYFDFCKDDFIKTLNLPKINIIKRTCFIHIKRGDRVNSPLHDFNLDNYHYNAINYIKIRRPFVKFLIFSNDIDYCKNHPIYNNYEIFNNNDEIINLTSMSLCEYGGISGNSTFSWWGGYLNNNKNKIITFPNKWFNDSNFIIDIYFKNSIVLSCDKYLYYKYKYLIIFIILIIILFIIK